VQRSQHMDMGHLSCFPHRPMTIARSSVICGPGWGADAFAYTWCAAAFDTSVPPATISRCCLSCEPSFFWAGPSTGTAGWWSRHPAHFRQMLPLLASRASLPLAFIDASRARSTLSCVRTRMTLASKPCVGLEVAAAGLPPFSSWLFSIFGREMRYDTPQIPQSVHWYTLS
jgi:hypothetical protein